MPAKDTAGGQRPCWEALQRHGQTWHQEGKVHSTPGRALPLRRPQPWDPPHPAGKQPGRMSVTPAGGLPDDRARPCTVPVLNPHPRGLTTVPMSAEAGLPSSMVSGPLQVMASFTLLTVHHTRPLCEPASQRAQLSEPACLAGTHRAGTHPTP